MKVRQQCRIGGFVAALTLCLGLAIPLFAQRTAVAPRLTQLPPQYVARHGLTSAQYQTTFTQLAGQGYRLKSVTGYVSNGLRFAGLWEKTTGPEYIARHNLTAAQYQTEFNTHTAAGFRLTYINGYEVNGNDHYAAIWVKTGGPAWTARHAMTAAQYQTAFNDLTQQGYRMIHVSGYTRGGSVRYAAIYDKSTGPQWVARHGLTAAQYQTAFTQYANQGYRLKSISGYRVGNADNYAAIWDKSAGPVTSARHGIPQAWYQNVFDNHHYQGYRPVFLGAFTSGNTARFNGIWENSNISAANLKKISDKANAYISTHGVPGLSFAITKDGRLVYAAGFGKANTSTGEEVGPLNLFRVASVSKPITAVAIMRLVETNRLTLNDRVFGPNSILGPVFATPSGNTQINNITVRHLLQHTSGFTTSPNDPMFQNTSMTHAQLINWVLGASDRRVTRAPGSRYEYSNFGYCILGRVIERRSGQTYEQFVRQSVLAPTGVTEMFVAQNAAAQKRPREVTYYPASAYNLNVRRFDAHGGWIASAVDLVRFLVRVDGQATKPDIITGNSFTTMTTPANINDANNNNPNYGLGWAGGTTTPNHNGAMTGTIAIMSVRTNGYTFAALVNMRPGSDGGAGALSQMVRDIITEIGTWPSYDLF